MTHSKKKKFPPKWCSHGPCVTAIAITPSLNGLLSWGAVTPQFENLCFSRYFQLFTGFFKRRAKAVCVTPWPLKTSLFPFISIGQHQGKLSE